MKNKLAAISSALALASLAQVATANDGTINFEGGVSDTTCTVIVNNQTNNATVKLPVVSSKLLAKKDDTAGRTFLNFELKDCALNTDSTSAGTSTLASKAAVYFVAGPNIITPGGYLKNTSGTNATTNVNLQILNKDLKPMDLSMNAGEQGAIAEDIAVPAGGGAPSAYIRHYVQYIATGAATAGGLTSNVDYEIDYQ